jgi:hypothetical protein
LKKLAILYGGSLPEHRVLAQPKYRSWLSATIPLLELPKTDLSRFQGLLVPEGLHHQRLKAASEQIHQFLSAGGTVCLFGDQPIPWLPGLDWKFRVANRPQPGELIIEHPESSFHQRLGLEDVWHHHGVFHPPAGAKTLLATSDGATVLYIDRVSTTGTLLVTSLDLLVHIGRTANPVSERFLERFLPWVVERL